MSCLPRLAAAAASLAVPATLLLALTVPFPHPTRAAEPAPALAEAAPQGEVVLEEIEVKSRREPRVDTLEVREVRESGARDLGDALQLVPSLDKVRKGGIANDLSLRGLKRDDVAVVIDGAHVHGACPARMDPPSFHLDYAEVDRVEVKKGPFDVSQPGGLGGVVDVRTRRARPGAGTELNLAGGSFGGLETSATASYGAEGWDALVGGAFKQGHPFVSGDGQNFTKVIPLTLPARFRDRSNDQTAYDVRSGFAKLGYLPAEGQRLEVGYTRQSAVDVLYPYLKMDGITDDTDRLTARWTVDAAGPLARARAEAYWSRVAHDMTDAQRCSSAANVGACSGALPRDYGMGTFARSTVWGAKLESGLAGVEDLVVGADGYLRSWDNTTTRAVRMAGMPVTYASEASIPQVSIGDAGLYAQLRRSLRDGVRVSGGVRADLAHTRAGVDRTALYQVFFAGQDLARSRTDLLVGGNVQAEWDVLPSASVFAGYGHGTRLPDPQERYIALSGMMGNADWVGFPGLRPVKSDELDLGVKWVGRGVLLKAQAFHAWLGDYIALAGLSVPAGAGTRTAKTYANVAARTFGYEAAGRVALPLRLYLGAAVSFTRGINDTMGTSLSEMPPLKATASLRWDTGVFFAELEEAAAARQDRVDRLLGEQPTPGWWVTNVRAGGEWKGMKLFAGVRNVFDRQYYEHLSYQRDPFAAGVKVPEPGRALQLTAQYVF